MDGDIEVVSEAVKISEIDYEQWLEGLSISDLDSMAKTVATMTGGNTDHNIKAFMQFHQQYMALQALKTNIMLN